MMDTEYQRQRIIHIVERATQCFVDGTVRRQIFPGEFPQFSGFERQAYNLALAIQDRRELYTPATELELFCSQNNLTCSYDQAKNIYCFQKQ